MQCRKRTLTHSVGSLLGVLACLLTTGLAFGQEAPQPADKVKTEIQKSESSKTESQVLSVDVQSTKTETNVDVTPTDSTNVNPVAEETKAEPVAVRAKTGVTPMAAPCQRTLTASVVAMAQPIMLNRLGATMPDGLIFALTSDTVANSNPVQLKPGKRPRPLVLRANVGDCLTITFTNAIPAANFLNTTLPNAKTGTTEVSLHVQGMEWVQGTQDDASFAGVNNSSLASAAP